MPPIATRETLRFLRRSAFALPFYPSHRRSTGAATSWTCFPVILLAFLKRYFVFAMPFLEFLHSGGVVE